jgi:hypothetical protein
MRTPEETVTLYVRQVKRRTAWLAVSAAVGLLVALAVHLSGSPLPASHAGLIAGGVLFFPAFIRWTRREDFISTREAIAAGRESRKKSEAK